MGRWNRCSPAILVYHTHWLVDLLDNDDREEEKEEDEEDEDEFDFDDLSEHYGE